MNVFLASTFSLQTNYWNVDPTFESVNKVLWCDLSNEASSAVLLNGRTFSSEFNAVLLEFRNFGEHFETFESRQKRIQNCISFFSRRWFVATKRTISTGMWHSTVSYAPMLRVCFLERNGLFIMLKRFLFICYLALLVPLHQRRYIPMFTKNNRSQHLLWSVMVDPIASDTRLCSPRAKANARVIRHETRNT